MADDKNDLLSAEDFGLNPQELGDEPSGEAVSQDEVDNLLDTSDGGEGEEETGVSSSSEPAKKMINMEGAGQQNINMILDVPLLISVELGRTKMLVNDLLQLGQGSVTALDKMAGEPMEIRINDKLVALGEVVVINERFGVRLTDVISNIGLEGDITN